MSGTGDCPQGTTAAFSRTDPIPSSHRWPQTSLLAWQRTCSCHVTSPTCTRPLETGNSAPRQLPLKASSSCWAQLLPAQCQPSLSPPDPPPSPAGHHCVGAVTSKLPSRAWLTVVVAQGAAEERVPLRRLLRRCRLGRGKQASVWDQKAHLPGGAEPSLP